MAENQQDAREAAGGTDGASNGQGLAASLLSKEVILPALVTAGGVIAYAARKGASTVEEKAEDEAKDLGRSGMEGAKESAKGGLFGGVASRVGGGGKRKKTRRLPIQRWTDVAVPVETAYERWTEFEEFPNFMHRVLAVKEEDDNKVTWDEKIWFSKRHWEGEITERRKNERIAWKTTKGMAHAGVVSFHRLDKNLTRIMVTMDFVPQGTIEKLASGLRFVKRAVQADLARFKAYVEMGEVKDLEYHAQPAEREGEQDGEEQGDGDRQGSREDREAAVSS